MESQVNCMEFILHAFDSGYTEATNTIIIEGLNEIKIRLKVNYKSTIL